MHITHSENTKEKNQWFKSLKVKFIQNYTSTIIDPSINCILSLYNSL